MMKVKCFCKYPCKEKFSYLLILLLFCLLLVSVPSYSQEEINYCYKPSKPLFLSTTQSKKRYTEDIQEYQRCQQYFLDMKQSTARLKKESNINEQNIMNSYMNHY